MTKLIKRAGNMKNITSEDINALIRAFDESDWKELALQVDDCRVFISRDSDTAGAPWQASMPAPKKSEATSFATQPKNTTLTPEAQPSQEVKSTPTDPPDNCLVVTAPNLGIFYRAPQPGAPPYVVLGAEVEKDTEICLIEVMKLFTPVQAGVKGIIRHICMEDGEMVEHGQPLFYVEPDA